MASSQLKNILRFVSGGPTTLPHNLNWTGRPVRPDHIELGGSGTGVEVIADEENVTINLSTDIDILVESWHTIERTFGNTNLESLVPQPFVVGGGGPTPGYAAQNVIIYARTTGSNETGDGRSVATAYRTMQRAIRDVPLSVPPGAVYIVDITGITEAVPAGYVLPPWKAAQVGDFAFSTPYGDWFVRLSAVNIWAVPVRVALPPGDDIINIGDILSVTNDPVTGLVTVTLTAPRASWGVNGIKGKQCNGAGFSGENSVIYENTPTSITLTTAEAPTTPLRIEQPSATITCQDPGATFAVIQALNCDTVGFGGLKVDGQGFINSLDIEGLGGAVVQLCDIDNPYIDNLSGVIFTRLIRNYIHGDFTYLGCPYSFFNQSFVAGDGGAVVMSGAPSSFVGFASVFEACAPVEPRIDQDEFQPSLINNMLLDGVLVRNAPGDGFAFHGGYGIIRNADIYGCAGNGITADQGSGYLKLENVQSSGAPNGGVGVRVNDAMQVKVDAATSGAVTPLTGTGGNMQVGSKPVRTWLNFTTVAPIDNEADFTSATATGSRLSQ